MKLTSFWNVVGKLLGHLGTYWIIYGSYGVIREPYWSGQVWCSAMKSGLDPFFGPMSVPLVQNLGWTNGLNPYSLI